MHTELFLPETNKQSKYPAAPTDRWLVPPYVAVNTAVPMPEMLADIDISYDFLPIQLKTVLEDKKIAHLIRLSIPWKELPDQEKIASSTKKILAPTVFGRALPLGYMEMKTGESGLVFTVLTGKGTLISGNNYPQKESDIHSLKPYFESGSPMGFFGLQTAKKDMFISQQLFKNGAYTSLTIGRIELSIDSLRKFIQQYWQASFPEIALELNAQLDKVVKNNDKPAYLLRLSSGAHRLFPTTQTIIEKSHNNPEAAEIHKRVKRAEIVKAVKIWQKELQKNHHWLSQPFLVEQSELLSVFSQMESRNHLSTKDIEILMVFVLNLLLNDYKGLMRTVDKNPEFIDICYSYFDMKDRDYSLKAHDFEWAGDVRSQGETPQLAAINSLKVLCSFYLQEVALLFSDFSLGDAFEEKISLMVDAAIGGNFRKQSFH